MNNDILEFLFEAVQWVIMCPAFGITFTVGLYGILDALKIDHSKQDKLKCWMFVTLCVIGIKALLSVFSR